MSDIDFSDIGDVLASRFAEIGIDPESEAPLNLPATAVAEPVETTDSDDLVARTLAAGDETPPETPDTQATPPVAPPSQPVAAEVSSTPPAVMAYLRDKYGADFSAKYTSDEAFLQGVLNLNKKIGERDEDAQLGRVLKESPDRVAAHLMQNYPQFFQRNEPAPQPAAPQAKPVDAAQFSPEWIAALQLKEGVDPKTRKEIATWLENQHLAQSPIGKELQSTRAELDQIKQMLMQGGAPQQQGPDVKAELAAFQQVQAAKEFVNTNPWLFTEVNGARVLSPDGFVYRQALETAQNGGANFEMAKEYADTKLAAHRARSVVTAPAKTPVNSPAAARQPAPAVPSTEETRDWIRDGEDLASALHRNLKRDGLLQALGQE